MTDRTSVLAFELRLFRHSAWEWLVMTGNRLLVSLLCIVGVAVAIAGFVASGLVPLERETPVLFLLFALIAANFTLIAIVTSLSQLVLSRQLESPGEIRGRIDETIAYREEVAATTAQPILPVKPDAFLATLYRNVRVELDELAATSADGRTKRAREELEELLTGLRPHTDYVIDLLEQPSSGLKHAMFTSLSTDYETQVHRAWHLQAEHADEFADRVAEPLANLAEMLEHIVVATRMFKTVFIEAELSELSRFLLYVGLPVQLVAVGVMLLYSAPGSGPPVSPPVLRVLVVFVLTAGFAPFLILSAYVVRLTVVARRTADNFPFSSQLDSTVAIRNQSSR